MGCCPLGSFEPLLPGGLTAVSACGGVAPTDLRYCARPPFARCTRSCSSIACGSRFAMKAQSRTRRCTWPSARSEHKEVLGIWIEQTEGAKYWLRVMTEIRNRGTHDVLTRRRRYPAFTP